MLSRLRHILSVALLSLVCGGLLSSCNFLIYDYEGDCSVHYKVKFRYDVNMLYADAFAHSVKAVTLYVLDSESGDVLYKTSESGEALAKENYFIEIPEGAIKPGRYDLLAWCDADSLSSFTLASSDNKSGLTAALNFKSDSATGKDYVDSRLDDLFYGYYSGADFTTDEGTAEVTMSLMKDTKNYKIFLQHISGDPISADKFDFSITDDNSLLNWDNTILPSGEISYKPWTVYTGSTSVTTSALTKAETVERGIACAEINASRLMLTNRDSARLTVSRKSDGKIILSVPLVDYALLFKGAINSKMADQDFLDRQGDFDMIFFLNADDTWMNAYIYINSWKIVLSDVNL